MSETLEDVIEYPETEYQVVDGEYTLSECCGARITELGFCRECGENAL